MGPKKFRFFNKNKGFLQFVGILVFAVLLSAQSIAQEPVSLKTYPELAIPVPNPVDMTKLPVGKTFQIADPQFVLQFFFNGRDIYGVILKREKEHTIFLHLCFFRSCEESKYDYIEKIVSPFEPPYEKMFFSVKLPRQKNYEFQGLEFFSIK